MNYTHLEHVVIAVVVQFVIVIFTGDWWIGAALGAGIFIGREHAQAEERYIAGTGVTRDVALVELDCLHPRWWSVDSILDLVAPAVAVCAVALLANW